MRSSSGDDVGRWEEREVILRGAPDGGSVVWSSGLERVPLGHRGAGVTHHVFPVLHLRRPTLPGEIDLWSCEGEREKKWKGRRGKYSNSIDAQSVWKS